MDHKHFKDGDVTKDEKRLHADLVLAAFLPDIDDIEGLIKRRGGQNWSGMDMPTLLYKRDIFPIREQLEARARDVLAVCPNPNPVRAPALASGTMLAPQQTTGAGSHLPSFVFGASSAALGPVAPIAGFDASATTFPYSTFAHSTNDNSEVDLAIVSPPTHDANSALAPPAFTYDESDAGSFDLAPSFPAGTHSTTFTFEHALPMPSRSDIYDGHEASDFASRPVPISPSHETADSFGAWIQEQKRREDEPESRGKMARAGKAGRALAAAPYGRPGITSRGGDAIAGSSRIRSSSVASHASTSSLDTVHSSASGYSTSASFTSSDSHPQSSRSSSFAPASREGSFGLYAHGHADTDYTLGSNPQDTADVPQLPMAAQHEIPGMQEFKRFYGAPRDY
ncbi:hypothetical protein PENSPDRAFT_142568 [Peniophora sp. CONT]|nr:hypothetical protein PENSPDRAFT_142568 [Peniophora sp. CONT]